MSPQRLRKLYLVFQLESITYLLTIPLAKLSVLLLCYRIFRSNNRFRRACYFLFIIIAGYALGSLLTALFRCQPVGAAWSSPAQGTARCLSLVKLQVIVGWFNIITDVALMVLPMPILWTLRMPWQKKVGVVVVFATGAAVLAMSVARQGVLYENLNGLDKDITWSAVVTHILFTLELHIAIICGCLPTMQPLFRRFTVALPSAFRSIFSTHQPTGRSRTRTGTSLNSKGLRSTGPPPPTWGSVPLRRPQPPATPMGEPRWTKEWYWGLMNDEAESNSPSGGARSGRSVLRLSPWKGIGQPLVQGQSAPKVMRNKHEGPARKYDSSTPQPSRAPMSAQCHPHEAAASPLPTLSIPKLDAACHEGEIAITAAEATSAKSNDTSQKTAGWSMLQHTIERATPTSSPVSPTCVRFASNLSQTQRVQSSSSRLHERRGRRSLDLGPLPSFHAPGPSGLASPEQRRRRSENDATKTPLNPHFLSKVREERNEG